MVGTYRRTSTLNLWRLDELGIRDHPNLKLVVHDLTDAASCFRVIEAARPAEIYNLGAQSFVATSFEQPATTTDITGLGTLHILEAIRTLDRSIRYYQASSAEMYGLVQATPQSETTPFYPRSPYAVAKLYAHWMTINYRESYGIFASCGILFNHESPLRGLDFVTRKITDGVARIALGDQAPIRLGNLNAERDWAMRRNMWRACGRCCKRSSLILLFSQRTRPAACAVSWNGRSRPSISRSSAGRDTAEIGICRDTGRPLVEVSPDYYRRRRSIVSSATHPRPSGTSGGAPIRPFASCAHRWSRRIWSGITGVARRKAPRFRSTRWFQRGS